MTDCQVRLRRSLMVSPGNVRAKVDKALKLPLDVLMLDLQDGVPNTDAAKAKARDTLGEALAAARRPAPREIALRVNGPRTRWFLDDLKFALRAGVQTLVIPMMQDAGDQAFAHRCLQALEAPDTLGVMLLIETPAAVLNLPAIVEAGPRTNGLIAGGLDYSAGLHSLAILPTDVQGGQPRNDSGQPRDDSDLIYLRHRVLATARAHGLSALDAMRPGVLTDRDALRREVQRARWLGFDGVDFFHPVYVDIANEVFTPSAEELRWAARVQEIAAGRTPDAPASFTMDGQVVLPQHVDLAARLQALARAIGQR